MAWLSHVLQHPLTVGMNVDDPRTTERRRQIIRSKRFLCRLYREWYERIRDHIPAGDGRVLELGSGAGFMRDCIPGIITSDVFPAEGIDQVLPSDGHLPFDGGTLKAIVMTDVFHHLCQPRAFFREATRVVRPGGMVVMIEPWVTPWSSFVYRRIHPEPFRPEAETWEFPARGPLSGANGALPWLVFQRDRAQFERDFHTWGIERIEPLMPFCYLWSGGVSLRALAPGWAYPPCRWMERTLALEKRAAMFALIVLVRNAGSHL